MRSVILAFGALIFTLLAAILGGWAFMLLIGIIHSIYAGVVPMGYFLCVIIIGLLRSVYSMITYMPVIPDNK